MVTAIALITSFVVALLITPLVKKLAFKIGATDQPNARKVHTGQMARMGGLAIYIAFLAGVLILRPENETYYYNDSWTTTSTLLNSQG